MVPDESPPRPELLIRGSPWRAFLMLRPFLVLPGVLFLLDRQQALDALPAASRNLAWLTAFLAALGVVIYFRSWLLLDSEGLTIRYPFHERRYAWAQLSGYSVQTVRLCWIPMLDIIRFQ